MMERSQPTGWRDEGSRLTGSKTTQTAVCGRCYLLKFYYDDDDGTGATAHTARNRVRSMCGHRVTFVRITSRRTHQVFSRPLFLDAWVSRDENFAFEKVGDLLFGPIAF